MFAPFTRFRERVSVGARLTNDLGGTWTAEERDIIRIGHLYWELIIRSLNVDEADPGDADYVFLTDDPVRTVLRNLATRTLNDQTSTRGAAHSSRCR